MGRFLSSFLLLLFVYLNFMVTYSLSNGVTGLVIIEEINELAGNEETEETITYTLFCQDLPEDALGFSLLLVIADRFTDIKSLPTTIYHAVHDSPPEIV